MKRKLNWQKKAILVFAGTIILLSVILTIFAIREAQREKLIREREIEEDQQIAAELIIDQINSIITESEERMSRMMQRAGVKTQEGDLAEACSSIMDGEEMVNEIFLISQDDKVTFPYKKPLFYSPGEEKLPRTKSLKIEATGLFIRAEVSEFRTKNYSQAIKSYQELLSKTSDEISRAVLLNCIGRCCIKSGKSIQAIEAYQRILDECPDESSPDGIPLGIIARYQIGNICSNRDERTLGIRALLELYQNLLESKWFLNRNQFHFYKDRVKAMLETSMADMEEIENKKIILKKWEELKRLEEERLKRASTREHIKEKIIPILKAQKTLSNEASNKFRHIAQRINDEFYLISYTFINNLRAMGVKIDSEILIKKLLPLKLGRFSLRKDWRVHVSDEFGNVLAGQDIADLQNPIPQLTFSRGFKDNFPPWRINIYQMNPGHVEKHFSMRRNLYLLSVVIVISALLFGGYLAIRSTGKELKLAKLKSDFVSTVSHEFRTPLTSIRYLAELLQRGRVRDEERKKLYYRTISDESERLSWLIENILNFSKMEAGIKEYQFAMTDMDELAENVLSRFQKQASGKKFTMESDISHQMPIISVDKDAISRALLNLLDNALKYSGENPKVKIRAWSDKKSVYLEVQDNGRGINKEEQRKVFEKFYRTDDVHESKVKGSGIGLNLVAHIVKAHGGEIALESDVGKGTIVTINLPRTEKQG